MIQIQQFKIFYQFVKNKQQKIRLMKINKIIINVIKYLKRHLLIMLDSQRKRKSITQKYQLATQFSHCDCNKNDVLLKKNKYKLPYLTDKYDDESSQNNQTEIREYEYINRTELTKRKERSRQPWMIVQHDHDEDQQSNGCVQRYKNNNFSMSLNKNKSLNMKQKSKRYVFDKNMITGQQKNMKPSDANLWTSKVNKKESYIILNYLNGIKDEDKKKKYKSKKKTKSTSLIQINSQKMNQKNNIIIKNKLNVLDNANVLYNQLLSTKFKRTVCMNRHNRHKKQLSSILLKQQLTLEKQQKLIEQLKDKVEQYQRSKCWIQSDCNQQKKLQTKKLLKSTEKLKKNHRYEHLQGQKSNIKIVKTQYKNDNSINNKNKNEQKQLIVKSSQLQLSQSQPQTNNKKQLNRTFKHLKINRKQKFKTTFPQRIPSLQFLQISTYYSLIDKKTKQSNEVRSYLMQSQSSASPIKSPNKRSSSKENNFLQEYLNFQLPKDQVQLKKFIDNYEPLNQTLTMQPLLIKPSFQIVLDPQIELYFGEIDEDKLKHGYGVHLQKKYIYEGVWENDSKVFGIQINQAGYYKGEFNNNKKQGKGEYKWKNNQYYNGDWLNGKKHGKGIWSSPQGDHYVGQWFQGKVEGQGIHTSYNGQQYEGTFKNYLKSGWGKEHLPNGDSYEGQFEKGKPHGKGTYRWKDGEVYEGWFVYGLRQKSGMFTDTKNNKYKGEFKQQEAIGKCDILLSNGDNYQGQIKNNKFNGKGKLRLDENQIWDGEWKDGQFISQN